MLVHETAVGRIEAYAAAIPPVTLFMFLANRVWTFSSTPRGGALGVVVGGKDPGPPERSPHH